MSHWLPSLYLAIEEIVAGLTVQLELGYVDIGSRTNLGEHTCKDFTCSTNGFCIHPDLLCDGINHCSDNSDESVHNLCQNETTNTVFGMDVTWFVLIVVSLLLILSAIIVGISICVCRRQEDNTTNQNTAIQCNYNNNNNNRK
uniref:EB domain-containing protein n=1 Tax=Glossina pallidipes TaxID=7398 RepID=A0A1B0A2I5_GLOPL